MTWIIRVGETGFEPATSAPKALAKTRLLLRLLTISGL